MPLIEVSFFIKKGNNGLGLTLIKNENKMPLVSGFKDMPDGTENPSLIGGIEEGDIIVAVNDERVAKVKDIPHLLKSTTAADPATIKLTVSRMGDLQFGSVEANSSFSLAKWVAYETDSSHVALCTIQKREGGLGISLKKDDNSMPLVIGFKDMPDGVDNPSLVGGVEEGDVKAELLQRIRKFLQAA